MAGPNDFTGQNIQDTYQRVLQISSSGIITDGTGSIIQLSSSSIQSATTASHALFAVSASHETTFELSSSHAQTADSASYVLASNIDQPFTNITASGIISASGTIYGTGLDIKAHPQTGSNAINISTISSFPIGYDVAETPTLVMSGSGLMISGNSNHANHAMLKIGGVELLDVNSTLNPDGIFLIHNVDTFLMVSGSEGGDLYSTTSPNRLISHDGQTFTIHTTASIAQYIIHDGDTDTKFGFTSDDKFEVFTGGVEMLQIDGTGTTFNVSAQDRDFKVAGNGGNLFILNDGSNRATFPTVSEFRIGLSDATAASTLEVGGDITSTNITASGNISASGDILSHHLSSSALYIASHSTHIGGVEFNNTLNGFVLGNTTVDSYYRSGDKHQYLTGRVIMGSTDFDNGAQLGVDGGIYTNSHITASGRVSASNFIAEAGTSSFGYVVSPEISSSGEIYTTRINIATSNPDGFNYIDYNNLYMKGGPNDDHGSLYFIAGKNGGPGGVMPNSQSMFRTPGSHTWLIGHNGSQYGGEDSFWEIRTAQNGEQWPYASSAGDDTIAFKVTYSSSFFKSPITASGDISASGNIIGAQMIPSNLVAGGNSSIDGKLHVGGTSQPSGILKVTGTSEFTSHITASGDISASGTIVARKIKALGSEISLENGNITASGNISTSGDILAGDGGTGSFDHILTQGSTIEFRDGSTKIGQLKVDDSTGFSFDTADGSDRKPVRLGAFESKDGNITGNLTASNIVSASAINVNKVYLNNNPTTETLSFNPISNALYWKGNTDITGTQPDTAGGSTGSFGRAGTQGWGHETGSFVQITIPPTEFHTVDQQSVRFYGIWARGVGAGYVRGGTNSYNYFATYVTPNGYKVVKGAVYASAGNYQAYVANIVQQNDATQIQASTTVHEPATTLSSSAQLVADADLWTSYTAHAGSYISLMWNPSADSDNLCGGSIILQVC